ncbi:MAG: D-alanyl-D-alanine carboxypeptidase/D-alanyl-D-alanine-endopeptidase [Pseudomonadota bacterium]
MRVALSRGFAGGKRKWAVERRAGLRLTDGMGMRFDRRGFVAALLSGVAAPAFAGAPARSDRPSPRAGATVARKPKSTERILAESGLSGAVGFVVADAKTGLVLESVGASASLPPASVAKAMTGAYALEVLGAEYTFKTRIIARGPVSGGILNGDLIFACGGDPILNTDHLGEMAAQLKARGIREVRGKFLVYGGALPRVDKIDKSQQDYFGYNPTISGAVLNFNRVHFQWKRAGGAWNLTMDARAKRYQPQVAMAQISIAERSTPIFDYRDGGRVDRWRVASRALGNGGSRWLPVRKPELYIGDVFRTLARSHGVVLPAAQAGTRTPSGTVLVQRESPPLRIIVRDMLKYSTNITAEVVGMTATLKRRGQVSGLRASASEMNKWARARFGVRSELVDHSGLGDASRITAADMVKTLVALGPQGRLAGLLKDIPIRNADYKVIKGDPNKVRAKTGTLNFVSSLAGYQRAPDGTDLAFAIFCADVPLRKKTANPNGDRPRGARTYNGRAKRLQQRLLRRWGQLYGA